VLLAGALGVTYLAWDHERQTSRKALRAQFDFALHDMVSHLEQGVLGYEEVLNGVQALVATTGQDNLGAVNHYLKGLNLDANYAGLQLIGLVQWNSISQKATVASAVSDTQGQSDLVLGQDVWADPVWRSALQKARDSGLPALSGKVLLDGSDRPSPGFVMVLPVYAQGQPHQTVERRRAALTSWVYATFPMEKFVSALYGRSPLGLDYSLYDGTQPTEDALLFRPSGDAPAGPDPRPAISANEYLVVAGHNWTLAMSTQDSFEARYGRGTEGLTAIAGTVMGVLLALLVHLMIGARDRALRLAEGMTQELRHMAQHDTLTGLANRALFHERLKQQLSFSARHNGRFALMFMDLDHFKPINDSFGHEVGDLVLKRVALQLLDSVRASDTVGRLGGDEFVVLLAPIPDSTDALAVANKLHRALHEPFQAEGHEFSISSSIGVAIYPDDGNDVLSLMRAADGAMYLAKAAGRDRIRLAGATS